MSVENDSWTVERDYPHPPERVFAAWADPSVKVRWFDLSDTAHPEYHGDFRVGGTESFRTPAGASPRFTYDAQYRDIVENERIVATYEMSMDGRRISVSVATVRAERDADRYPAPLHRAGRLSRQARHPRLPPHRHALSARPPRHHARGAAVNPEGELRDVITFDVLPPLNARGRQATVEHLQNWFDGYDGPIDYSAHDVHVSAQGDLGFCSFLYHVGGTLKTGDRVNMWVRATLCCRRRDGRWRIAHDHESVPFDPVTGQALLSQEPQ